MQKDIIKIESVEQWTKFEYHRIILVRHSLLKRNLLLVENLTISFFWAAFLQANSRTLQVVYLFRWLSY